jgi:hypothetical protein
MSETAVDGARLRGEGAQGGRWHRHSSASCSRTGAWKILERDELAPARTAMSLIDNIPARYSKADWPSNS